MTETHSLPLVSVVAVNYRQTAVTCDMLDTLRACAYPALEVILVDNGSLADESARWRAHYPEVVALRSEENLGFAGGTNLGIREARGAYVLLLNTDTLVGADFLFPLVEILQRHPHVGMVSPKIVFAEPAGVIQYAGAVTHQPLLGRGVQIGHREPDHGQHDDTRETGHPHGACMLVRREVFDAVGLLPEFYFLYFEELDFAEQARRAGYGVMYCGASSIVHRQSVSIGPGNPQKTYYLHRNRVVFFRRALSGAAFAAFALYYYGVGLPINLLRHARAREWGHARALLRAVRDVGRVRPV